MLAGRNSSPDPVVVPYAPEADATPVWWEGLTEPCPCFPKVGTGCRTAQPPWWHCPGGWGAVRRGRGRRGAALTCGQFT